MKEKEDRGPLDLTFLLEQHAKEKWELTQQLSKAAEDLTILQGTKKLVENLAEENTQLKEEYKKEHKLRQEAQGETTIVKGIGMNSPEMEKAQARIKELDNSLAIALEINEEHQRYNGKLQTRLTDVEEDNKKLAHQVEDLKMYNRRKAGL